MEGMLHDSMMSNWLASFILMRQNLKYPLYASLIYFLITLFNITYNRINLLYGLFRRLKIDVCCRQVVFDFKKQEK